MQINLNSSLYQDHLLCTNDILNLISDYQIFKFYVPDLKVGKALNSPLRKDLVPSFSIFYSDKYQKLLFYDQVTLEKGDCFIFVMKLFNLSYYNALCKVCQDFNLELPYEKVKGLKRITQAIPKNIDYTKTLKISIGIKGIPFTNKDVNWWKSGGVSESSLKRFNVFNCSHIFITYNGNRPWIIPVDNYSNPSYAYLENKDKKPSYKVYSPFNKEHKFINAHQHDVWDAWDLLPKNGDNLIITKSRKDVISISEVQNIPSVSLQSETILPKKNVVKELKERFKNIYLLYDNDFDKTTNWGRIYGAKLANEFDFKQIEIPSEYKSKDHFELVANKCPAREIINNLISK